MEDEANASEFESTRLETPLSTQSELSPDALESVRVNLEKSLTVDASQTPSTPEPSNALKEKFSGLNSKLSSYMSDVRKTERLLIESEERCRKLEEKTSTAEADHRKQIEMLRTQLDEQTQKAVVADERRVEAEQRLDDLEKQTAQTSDELEAAKRRAAELEHTLNAERRATKSALGELVTLREQMVEEQAEHNRLKQHLTTLKIANAKFQERFKLNSAELDMHQTKLLQMQKNFRYTAADVERKLAEQRRHLELKFSQQLAATRHELESELERSDSDWHEKLNRIRASTVKVDEFDLVKRQLDEQRKRANAAEAEMTNWRERQREFESQLQLSVDNYVKQLEQERCRREKLNQRLLLQSRAQDEVRQQLDNYRKLLEQMERGCGPLCDSPLKQLSTNGGNDHKSSFGVASARCSLLDEASNSPDARSSLLRKAVLPRKRTLSGDSDSFMKVANLQISEFHET